MTFALLTCNKTISTYRACGEISIMDPLLISIDNALRTLFAKPVTSRSYRFCDRKFASSSESETTENLSKSDVKLSGALMRVNHVGEVCAQALYASQCLATSSPKLQANFQRASKEEFDHLAWTQERIAALNDHTSYLNPLWYAGAFTMGYLIGKLGGDKMSLGFVVETERQVSEHLNSHLKRLPPQDTTSRAIVRQMIIDEEAHAKQALASGAEELPAPIKSLMRLTGKVMTVTAHRI